MDYKKLINDAIDNNNWQEVIRLANKANFKNSDNGFFGIKKGHINLFRCIGDRYNVPDQIANVFKEYPEQYEVFIAERCFFNELKAILTPELISDKFFCIFTNNKPLEANIAKLEYPKLYFTQAIKTKWNDKTGLVDYTFTINSEREKYVFNTIAQLKGMFREQQIDSIFKD